MRSGGVGVGGVEVEEEEEQEDVAKCGNNEQEKRLRS